MNDGDALLRAVIQNPDEDTPRLVYADWLQENGQPERAEFVRAMVWREAACWTGNQEDAVRSDRHRIRAGSLFDKYRGEWFALPGDIPATIHRNKFIEYANYPPHAAALVRRGFVSEVRCSAAAWLEHGPRVVAAHPVTRVVLVDREPYDGFGPARRITDAGARSSGGWLWQWWGNDPDGTPRSHRIPRPVMVEMYKATPRERRWHRASERTTNCYFPTRDDALDALSRACLLWAKGAVPVTP